LLNRIQIIHEVQIKLNNKIKHKLQVNNADLNSLITKY